MASSSFTLAGYGASPSNTVFALASNSDKGALYKVTSRTLNAPHTLTVSFTILPAGALGLDRVAIQIADTQINSTTGKSFTARIKCEVTIPRDSCMTDQVIGDLMAHAASLLAVKANQDNLLDAMVP